MSFVADNCQSLQSSHNCVVLHKRALILMCNAGIQPLDRLAVTLIEHIILLDVRPIDDQSSARHIPCHRVEIPAPLFVQITALPAAFMRGIVTMWGQLSCVQLMPCSGCTYVTI